MFLQRGVLQSRKEAAVNFGCPPVYHNYTVGGNGMLCIEAKNDEYYRVQPVFGNQDGSWSNTVLAEGYKGSFY